MKNSNRLIDEKSPYLIQHAYNPVDWYPWCDEVFEKANEVDKPIFLSIGYSTCHWCHVMEKESFEDEEIAEILNKNFLSIKVDREERPDIDSFYMNVCQMMTGGGGWPLTIVMTPEKKPFFAGTYYPKERRGNRPGLKEILNSIIEVWETRKEDVIFSSNEIVRSVKENNHLEKNTNEIGTEIFEEAYSWYESNYDKTYGGFGRSPKFPSPHNLMFLLRQFIRTRNEKALEMVENTLLNMRKGGIFDQVGGGFHRYSTDEKWLVPHFEKMLYDQAMLILAYSELYQITKNDLYKKTIEEVINYIQNKLTSPEGGFYSSEDADSEGEEGKYYIWSYNELERILLPDEMKIFSDYYNVKKGGNWVDMFNPEAEPTNIPYLSNHEFIKNENAGNILNKLYAIRERRIPPLKDTKILTDWNALIIMALTKAGSVLGNNEYIKAASKCADFIIEKLVDEEGKLLHRYKDGESKISGFADDYSFFINALIELYESTFESEYLKKAIELSKIYLDGFWDNEGGFFNTSNEELPTKQKDIYDGAIPSSNSFSLIMLFKLYRITGEEEYLNKAEKMIDIFSGTINRAPMGYTMFLNGLGYYFESFYEIVISGKKEDIKNYKDILDKYYLPNKILLYDLESETNNIKLKTLEGKEAINNKTMVYICNNFECLAPVSTTIDFETKIKELTKNRKTQ